MNDLTNPRTVPCAHCGGAGTIELPPEVATVETYYYGCWHESGHYWRSPSLGHLGSREIDARVPDPLRRGAIDGPFAPQPAERVETIGEAALHHVDGWTVLAWWDRSVDTRPGSNSAIVSRGVFDFTTMLEIGKAQMPHVIERQRVPIVLVVDKTRKAEP